jgi:hypothetical protein
MSHSRRRLTMMQIVPLMNASGEDILINMPCTGQ